jgi:hypothetical protein
MIGNLYSLRQTLLNVDNFSLEPITLGQDPFSAPPTIQGPPAQFLAKGDSRWLCTATRSMLEIVSLMAISIFKKPPIEMIVDALGRIAFGHRIPLLQNGLELSRLRDWW